jgi:hypothetical protein
MKVNTRDFQDFISGYGLLFKDRQCLAGVSDYQAENFLNANSGAGGVLVPSAGWSRFLALFTAAPTSDAGTGGTEVSTSGTGYARIQFAGEVAAGASWTTSSSTITLGSTAPAWLTALGTNGSGCNVFDITTGQNIGTISSVSGTTITLTADAAHASSGSTDALQISAFPLASASTGTEPAVTPANVTNGAVINMYTTGVPASWGTVVAWGVYDAVTGGNFITWDFLGTYKWIPFTCTNASPGVLTCDATADAPANGSSIVVTSKFGGTLPTTGGSWAGLLTTANLSGATFTAGVNTTSIGGGQFRQVTSLAIGSGIGPISFAASTLTLSLA